MVDKNTNKEIEEIIEYFRNDIKWLEEELKNPHYLGYYITIRDKEYEYLKQLLDYITNLQEEKEKYKRFVDNDFLYTYEELQDKVIKKQQRIDKAIELLKQWGEEPDADMYLLIKEYKEWKELLDILRGEDNG